MGLGDQIAQNFIDNSKTIDFVRTMQFAGIGLFITVSNYKYYIILKTQIILKYLIYIYSIFNLIF